MNYICQTKWLSQSKLSIQQGQNRNQWNHQRNHHLTYTLKNSDINKSVHALKCHFKTLRCCLPNQIKVFAFSPQRLWSQTEESGGEWEEEWGGGRWQRGRSWWGGNKIEGMADPFWRTALRCSVYAATSITTVIWTLSQCFLTASRFNGPHTHTHTHINKQIGNATARRARYRYMHTHARAHTHTYTVCFKYRQPTEDATVILLMWFSILSATLRDGRETLCMLTTKKTIFPSFSCIKLDIHTPINQSVYLSIYLSQQ